MPYVQTHSNFWLCSLTEDQHSRTCGYWWTLTKGGIAHTAFRTEYALREFFNRIRVTLPELVQRGEWASWSVPGEYRTCMHIELTREQFEQIPGSRFRAMSNGQYTEGIAETGGDGIVTIHTMNPNCKDRKVFDYWESSAIEETGRARSCKHCSGFLHLMHRNCMHCGIPA